VPETLDRIEPRTHQPAGDLLLREIREQPAVIRRHLAQNDELRAVAARLRRKPPTMVRLVGHGSSDNAASLGIYAFGLLPGWTALRDSMSLSIYYGAELDFRGSCVIALSQSGRTQDVVEYVALARQRGAFTIAVTNDVSSELASAAEAVVPLCAGREEAVAATKTYTAELTALLLLAAGAADQEARIAGELSEVAGLAELTLEALATRLAEVATSLEFLARMFIVARGPEFATAREIALKLIETCRIGAEPLTATSFAHGPIAAVDELFPVWAVTACDPSLPAIKAAVDRALAAQAVVIASGPALAALPRDAGIIELPTPVPPRPLLGPLLSVLPGQLVAWATAHAKGFDPDRPHRLDKVTLAP
jgi:glutamine---fructose-6-phosphate transaminase (isomerizing)